MDSFSSNRKHERGQGLVKYTIILALIAMALIGIVHSLGPNIGDSFSTVSSSLGDSSAGRNFQHHWKFRSR